MKKRNIKFKTMFFGRTGCTASRDLLASLLSCGHDVTYIESGHRGEQLPRECSEWKGHYIICFEAFLSYLKISLIGRLLPQLIFIRDRLVPR